LFSHLGRLLLKIFCLVSLKKPWLCICNLHQLILYEPPTNSICGCQKKRMMSLMLLLILFQMIRRCNMSLLSCLKWHTQVVYFMGERSNLQSCANVLIYILSCHNLTLLKPFDGLCLEHALLKGALIHYYGWKYICWSTLCIYGRKHGIKSHKVWIVLKNCFSNFWKITMGTLYIKRKSNSWNKILYFQSWNYKIFMKIHYVWRVFL
jgi:hypothetical protein